ncbi:MlaD family protein [Porphyromonadaceae bacterium W3.11]|nr:MlaD family protein [Porphyromonadaceae bacterium W3.11]
MKNKLGNKEKSIWIGITTVATLLMFYFGFNFLKGIKIFDKAEMYYVTFKDLQGIDLSSKVTLNGYKVGNVRTIDFDYTGMDGAVLTVALDKSLELPKGVKASITANPLGGAVIVLKLPKDVQEGIVNPHDTITGIPSEDLMGKLNNQLLPNLNKATLSLDTLIYNLNLFATDPAIKETVVAVKQSANAIQTSTQKIDKMIAQEIPTILDNIDASTKSIAEMTGKLNESDLELVVADLSTTVKDLKGFISKLNSDQGSIGQLINDPQLYNRLIKTTESADSLLLDIQSNPKKYVHFSIF